MILYKSTKIKKIEFFMPFIKNKRVVDFGCVGDGKMPFDEFDWIYKHIYKNARYCLGIDINLGGIEKMKKLGYNAMHIDEVDFNNIKKFDIVCAFDVITHIEDLKSFFEKIDKLLKVDGKLLISVPQPWFIRKLVSALIKGKVGSHPEQVFWFSIDTIQKILKRFNYKVEYITYGSGEPLYYHLKFLPKIVRHTSIYVISQKRNIYT